MYRKHLSRRKAVVALWALGVLALSLVTLTLTMNLAWFTLGTTEVRRGVDAVARGATLRLVDDDQLRGSSVRIADLEDRAGVVAQELSRLNVAFGQTLAPSLRFTFLRTDVFGTMPSLPSGVRVTYQRTHASGNPVPLLFGGFVPWGQVDVQVRTTAVFDRDVDGFRPLPEVAAPVVPLAIRSDATGTDGRSWEFLVEQGNGSDQFAFDRTLGRLVPDAMGDQLREITLALPVEPGGNPATSNGYLLAIGTPDEDTFLGQIADGLVSSDLTGLGGQLVLGPDGAIPLPGNPLAPPIGMFLDEIALQLDRLRQSGQARVWPLAELTGSTSTEARVHGFVAARVAAVEIDTTVGGVLRVTLQPALRATSTAHTDASRRGTGLYRLPNPYVGKVRLSE